MSTQEGEIIELKTLLREFNRKRHTEPVPPIEWALKKNAVGGKVVIPPQPQRQAAKKPTFTNRLANKLTRWIILFIMIVFALHILVAIGVKAWVG